MLQTEIHFWDFPTPGGVLPPPHALCHQRVPVHTPSQSPLKKKRIKGNYFNTFTERHHWHNPACARLFLHHLVRRWWWNRLCWASRWSPSWPGPCPVCCSSGRWTCSWCHRCGTPWLKSDLNSHCPRTQHHGTVPSALRQHKEQEHITMKKCSVCLINAHLEILLTIFD